MRRLVYIALCLVSFGFLRGCYTEEISCETWCEGNAVHTECSNESVDILVCDAPGWECVEDTSYAQCVTLSDPDPICDEVYESLYTRCDGNTLVTCYKGYKQSSESCGAGTCVADWGGYADDRWCTEADWTPETTTEDTTRTQDTATTAEAGPTEGEG